MKRDFRVFVLGSSSALPSYDNFSSSHLLKIHNSCFLIDAGEGVQIQLRRFKLRYFKIEHIFITHLHGDHFFGLLGLLSSYNLLHREKPLHIHAPAELPQMIFPILNNVDTALNYPVYFHTLKPGLNKIYEDKNIKIYSFELQHRLPTWGFLFQEQPLIHKIRKEKLQQYSLNVPQIHALLRGEDVILDNGQTLKNSEITIPPPSPRSYAYVSDTLYYPKLSEILKNITLLYHEATFLKYDQETAKNTMHSTAEQAAKIAKLVNAQKLLIGHFSDRYKNKNLFLQEAKTIFPNVILAKDGLEIEI